MAEAAAAGKQAGRGGEACAARCRHAVLGGSLDMLKLCRPCKPWDQCISSSLCLPGQIRCSPHLALPCRMHSPLPELVCKRFCEPQLINYLRAKLTPGAMFRWEAGTPSVAVANRPAAATSQVRTEQGEDLEEKISRAWSSSFQPSGFVQEKTLLVHTAVGSGLQRRAERAAWLPATCIDLLMPCLT